MAVRRVLFAYLGSNFIGQCLQVVRLRISSVLSSLALVESRLNCQRPTWTPRGHSVICLSSTVRREKFCGNPEFSRAFFVLCQFKGAAGDSEKMSSHGDTVESVHTLLVEVGLPASLEDIKNPSEEFMVTIISAFFETFAIDVATIKRLTMGQLDALDVTGQENAQIAHLINLQEVMKIIGAEIFIKEFNITDITSPRQVRTKKLLMLIGNFMLYAKNKKCQMQERINEVLGRGQKIQEIRKHHQEIIERTNNLAMETQRKKLEIERMKMEIVEREKRIEEKKLRIGKNEKRIKEKMSIKTQEIARNQAKRSELQKRKEQSNQLTARVVKSPDRIRGQLRELERERKNQEDKREDIQAAFSEKKAIVQKYDEALTLIRKEHPKLKELIDDQKKLNSVRKESERIDGEIDEVLKTINLEENLGSQEEQQIANRAIQEVEREAAGRIDKLKKIWTERDAEKKASEKKRENLESRCSELEEESSKIQRKVTEVETDILTFIKQCQEIHDCEISKIRHLHHTIESEQVKK